MKTEQKNFFKTHLFLKNKKLFLQNQNRYLKLGESYKFN